MNFHKVKVERVSVRVAQQIVDLIRAGVFKVGDKLPPEAELAKRMGVSRPSIREALSALAAVGLIEAKPGSGNFVRNGRLSAEEIGGQAIFILESEASCLEIMEARQLLEPPIASLAARNRTEQDIERLKAIRIEMDALAKQGDFDPYLDSDKRFHLALVEATGNLLILNVLSPLINTMDQKLYREFTRDYYLKDQMELKAVSALHEGIFRAIIAQDEEQAAIWMQKHWKRMEKVKIE